MSIRQTLRERFDRHWMLEPYSGCWLWTGGQRSTGYGAFTIGYLKDRNERMESAHRVAWMLFRGEIPEGLCVLHRCDVRLCVNPDHLFLGTIADNNHDMALKGRAFRRCGERYSIAGLKESDIASIRSDNRKQSEIAKDFGICQSHVSRIKTFDVWRSQ